MTTMKSKLRKVRMGTVGCCVFVLPQESCLLGSIQAQEQASQRGGHTGLSPKKVSWDKFGSYSGQLVFNYCIN